MVAQTLPYQNFPSQVLSPVLPAEQFTQLQSYVHKILTVPTMLNWCPIFMRYQMNDSPLMVQLHQQVLPQVEEALKRKLAPTYSFMSMYGGHGICPGHRDRNRCQWTLDLCINQDQPWPIYVENEKFIMTPNQGLVYSGTDQFHWRPRIHAGGHCHLAFFHFKEV